MIPILLVEDDREIARLSRLYLESTGLYEVVEVHSAEAALLLVEERRFECILLDIMLPDMDGIAFCKEVRSRLYCPIIFTSCLDDDETIVKALKLGGDDYLVKPYSKAKLLAFVEANLRRATVPHSPLQLLSCGPLKLDPARRLVTKNGTPVDLSPTEYELLYQLMSHPDEVLSFEDLYERVWGKADYAAIRPLFTHILNLRKKIEDDAKNPQLLLTWQRNGYIMKAK
ncbi:MAG: response regulator transcription factor [Lachnospiraceae bacterium]|nr:response regulator transcription factor [Lachnospiraceae bacterium]